MTLGFAPTLFLDSSQLIDNEFHRQKNGAGLLLDTTRIRGSHATQKLKKTALLELPTEPKIPISKYWPTWIKKIWFRKAAEQGHLEAMKNHPSCDVCRN